MRFIFDANLSPRLPRALNQLYAPDKHAIVAHVDKFKHDAKDPDWISALSKEGNWIILSCDLFKKNPIEREAIANCGLLVYVMTKGWGNLGFDDKAWKLVRWWPRIVQHAEVSAPAPYCFAPKISGKGKIEQYSP